jgi:hypothetical protein
VNDLAGGTVPVLWAVVQIAGLFSAFVVRRSLAGRVQGRYQGLFYACLALVGCSTMAGMAHSFDACAASGATLSIMTLAATWDAGPTVTDAT